ncbi:MAG: hypothetical protein K6G89_09580 [Clostridia bacterium]|nr:hypothetical protein [Clostridia bacterium]
MKKIRIITFIVLFALTLSFGLFAAGSFADVTKQPQSVVFPEFSDISYSCESDSETAVYRWFLRFDGVDYDLDSPEIDEAPWIILLEGGGFGVEPDGKGVYLENVPKDFNGASIYCVIDENGTEVRSQSATICIGDSDAPYPPVITVPVGKECFAGEEISLTCGFTPVEGVEYSVEWFSCGENRLEPHNTVGTANELRITHAAAGKYYYFAAVKAASKGKSAVSMSSVIEVTVLDLPATEQPTEPATEAPTGTPEANTPDPTKQPQETPTPTASSPTETPYVSDTPGTSDIPTETAGNETPAGETGAPYQATDIPLETPKTNNTDNTFFEKYKIYIIIGIAAVIVVIIIIAVASSRNRNDGGSKNSSGKGSRSGSTGKKSSGKGTSKSSSGRSGSSKSNSSKKK